MLQAHSLLWHYLWLAPHIYGLLLVALVWRNHLQKQYPVFVFYLLFASIDGISLYVLDVAPGIDGKVWWGALWVGTIVEGMLKFAVIGELAHHLLRSWPSIAKLGRSLVSAAGIVLVLIAAVAAAYSAPDSAPWFIGGAHVLLQTIYLAAGGLIVSMFALAAWLHIPWERPAFGIALGAGLVWCEHLAIWALIAGGVVRNRTWVDFANMGTYHISVLIWYYYLLVPEKKRPSKTPPKDRSDDPPVDPPSASSSSGAPQDHEETLNDWNRELERLIHQ
jgi:hypothetical protein